MGNDDQVYGIPITEEHANALRNQQAINFFEEFSSKRIKIFGGPGVTDFIGFIATPKDHVNKNRTFFFHLCSEDSDKQITVLCSFYECAMLGNINSAHYSMITIVCEIDNLHRYALKGRYWFHERKGLVRFVK